MSPQFMVLLMIFFFIYSHSLKFYIFLPSARTWAAYFLSAWGWGRVQKRSNSEDVYCFSPAVATLPRRNNSSERSSGLIRPSSITVGMAQRLGYKVAASGLTLPLPITVGMAQRLGHEAAVSNTGADQKQRQTTSLQIPPQWPTATCQSPQF